MFGLLGELSYASLEVFSFVFIVLKLLFYRHELFFKCLGYQRSQMLIHSNINFNYKPILSFPTSFPSLARASLTLRTVPLLVPVLQSQLLCIPTSLPSKSSHKSASHKSAHLSGPSKSSSRGGGGRGRLRG